MTEITQEEAAQAAGHSVKAATTYVVLAQELGGEATPDEGRGTVSTKPVWRNVGEFTARTAEAAIRQYAGPPGRGRRSGSSRRPSRRSRSAR